MLFDLFKKNCTAKMGSAGNPADAHRTGRSVRPSAGGGCLSIGAIEALAARGHVRQDYPHVWERICLFCVEPAHLEKYLASLYIQDRGGKRTGLLPDAMIEIAHIQAANQRFLQAPATGSPWSTTATNR